MYIIHKLHLILSIKTYKTFLNYCLITFFLLPAAAYEHNCDDDDAMSKILFFNISFAHIIYRLLYYPPLKMSKRERDKSPPEYDTRIISLVARRQQQHVWDLIFHHIILRPVHTVMGSRRDKVDFN